MGVRKNNESGLNFESIFERLAQLNGFLVIKNHLTCRFLWGGKVQVVKGQLDFTLIRDDGKVGFFDCKSYEKKIQYSQLEPNQVKRAIAYSNWNVPSGFVAHFRASDEVVLISGAIIEKKGPGSSFTAKDGVPLGDLYDFKVKKLMK